MTAWRRKRDGSKRMLEGKYACPPFRDQRYAKQFGLIYRSISIDFEDFFGRLMYLFMGR